MNTDVRISLVIPAHNEQALLPRLLDTVDAARRRYRFAEESVEVIVADNASIDGTAVIAEDRGCSVVRVEERRIASARNGGARLAHGSILSFVDADTRIHEETFNAIEDSMATGKVVAGATGVRLERMSLGIAATYALFMPLVWALRMDTGVVFCRRSDFEAIGGYDERRFFGEDVQLLFDLRRIGRPRRQRLVRLRPFKAIASCRKFDIHGDWHYFTDLFRLVPMMLNAPAETSRFADKYWYGKQRIPDDTELRV
jgi:glycosyltransferase involved in cell wall biosynthesis